MISDAAKPAGPARSPNGGAGTEILVLGAGMVGISTALALQEWGHSCTVVDRRAPGQETSFGNAGIIQSEAVEPYALPWQPWNLIRMALGEKNAVAFDLRGLAAQGGAIARYWRHSFPAGLARASAVYAESIRASTAAHGDLVRAAGADNLVHRDGYWEICRNRYAFDAAAARAERLGAEFHVKARMFDAEAFARAEPALLDHAAGAVHWQDAWWCSAPGALVEAYTRLFVTRGGRIVQGDAATLARSGDGWSAAGITADRVVVALGPWSPDLLRNFGYRVPMIRKRGHHAVFTGEHGLSRPLLDAGSSVVVSPMEGGLRMTTGADLSRASKGERPVQIVRGERAVRAMLPVGPLAEGGIWSGTRPCLPHMLPLVREAPNHDGLWMNFGHGHQGFTLGPVTGRALAAAMAGDTTAIAGLDRGIS